MSVDTSNFEYAVERVLAGRRARGGVGPRRRGL